MAHPPSSAAASTPRSDLPPYEPARILSAPFPERVRLVCRTWAAQVFPNAPIVPAIYWLRYLLLFVGGWAFMAIALQKAILR